MGFADLVVLGDYSLVAYHLLLLCLLFVGLSNAASFVLVWLCVCAFCSVYFGLLLAFWCFDCFDFIVM